MILGGDGADLIDATLGDDNVDAGSGSDLIYANGSDWIYTGSGIDQVHVAVAANDFIVIADFEYGADTVTWVRGAYTFGAVDYFDIDSNGLTDTVLSFGDVYGQTAHIVTLDVVVPAYEWPLA